MSSGKLTCPDCKLDLAGVESGSVVAHRCDRCRGVWLDPASFRRICEEEARPADEAALVAAHPRPPGAGPARETTVRYRACPACGELMNRSNFGRVSGVILDVCRADGAWFDRGELGQIRRFLQAGGLDRYDRRRRMADAIPSGPSPATPGRRDASLVDLCEVLVGGDGGWDVPSRIPRLLVAAVCTALGGGFLWIAFHPRGSYSRSMGLVPVVMGLGCLYFAWRALEQWAARRRR